MNLKKLKIDKDYNRLINILLVLYVTLCLIFALLYNGYFIKPKAYTSSDNLQNLDVTITVSDSNNSANDSITVFTGTTNLQGNNRGIFIYNESIIEYARNNISSRNNNNTIDCALIYVYSDKHDGITFRKTNSSGNINTQLGIIPSLPYVLDNDEMIDAGFPTSFLNAYSNVGIYANMSANQSIKVGDDFQYVTSYEDLKKYLVDGDDTVVKNGNPQNPKTVVSSNIPTPQKVTILENGENPCVVWDNPKDVKKFGDKINIEIGFKPTFKLYYGLHFADTVACTDYIGAWLGKLGTHNGFCVLKNSGATTSNELNGYDMIYDDNYIYDIDPNTDYDKSYIKFAIDQTGKTNLVPFGVGQPPTMSKKLMKGNKQIVGGGDDLPTSIWDTLAPEVLSEIKGLFNGGTVGTSDFRIRYTVNDGDKILVSPWVIAKRNFDNNNNATDDTDISFTDKDDNPIQNPTYLPSSSTNVAQPTMISSDAWWLNFNGYTANLFTNIGQQMSEWTNDSGGFLGFFAELFNEFPFLSWLLLFSLTLALFLRIFGR